MTRIAEDLVELSRGVEFSGRSDIIVKGASVAIEPPGDGLEKALAEALYRRHYCRPTRMDREVEGFGLRDSLDLTAAYSAANSGCGTWESGWRVKTIVGPGDHLVMEKHGIAFWANRFQVRTANNRAPHPGTVARVKVPNELRDLFPGFYVFLGNATATAADEAAGIARFYWHVTEPGGPAFVAMVSKTLNGDNIPFRAKVVSRRDGFFRADAAVLYVSRRRVQHIRRDLGTIYRGIRQFLRPSTPMFTLPIAPGLGAADDPGQKDSFGQHRCMLAARALLSSFRTTPPTQEERLDALAQSFIAHGLSIERPYLLTEQARDYPNFGFA